MRKNPDVTLHLLLSDEVDEGMRCWISRRGDLRDLVLGMFEAVDLTTVVLSEPAFKVDAAKATSVRVPGRSRLLLKQAAKARKCSMHILMNSGMKSYIEQKHALQTQPRR